MKFFKLLFTLIAIALTLIGVLQLVTHHGPWMLIVAIVYATITFIEWLPGMIVISILQFGMALAVIAGGQNTDGFVMLGIALTYAIFTLVRGLSMKKAQAVNAN